MTEATITCKRDRRRWARACATASALLALVCAAPASAATPRAERAAMDYWAKRFLSSHLAERDLVAVGVACRRRGRATRRRTVWSCKWSGQRDERGRTRDCSGRSRVYFYPSRHGDRRRGRWRIRRLRAACRARRESRDAVVFGFSDNSWLDPIYGITADDEAALAAAVGARAHRVFIDWRYAEPQRDVLVEGNFDHYVRVYNALLARGIQPLIGVGFAPRWAWEPFTWCNGELCRLPPARDEDDEWAEFVAEVARRFPRAAIEIWNEPNIDVFYRNPDPRRYAELVRIAYRTIKRVNPQITVVAGALGSVPSPPPRGDTPTRDFLDALYREGLAGHMDVLSMHTYPYGTYLGEGSRFRVPIDVVRAVRDHHGDSDRRLWLTEVGISTTDSRPGLKFDEATQARVLANLHREIDAMPDVDAWFVHSLLERPRQPEWSQERGYGVMRAVRPPQPKPAYCALAEAVASARPAGC